MLRLSDLQITPSGRPTLRQIHIELAEGALGLLLGAADSGKSTILETIAVGHWSSIGKLSWRGRNLVDLSPPARRRLGIACALQNPPILGGLTAADYILLGRSNGGGRNGARFNILEVIPELAGIRNSYVDLLTRPMRRLVDLARALAGNTQLLLIDDLTVDLGVARMIELIGKLRARPLTLLIADRYAAPLLPQATIGWLLADNRIVLAGGAAKLAGDPRVVSVCAGDLIEDF